MGVGYQNLYVISSLYNMYALVHPEIITNKLSEEDGHIKYNEEELNDIMKHSDSISIGMGMKVSSDLYNSIKYLLMNYDKTLIIDADGLNSLSKYGVDILANKKCKVILTPHLKEFERLSGYSVNEIKNDSINIAIEFARKYNITLVLKSQTTIITDGNRLSINISGNSGLAKAGSGDSLVGILSGICGYFLGELLFNLVLSKIETEHQMLIRYISIIAFIVLGIVLDICFPKYVYIVHLTLFNL
jgi:NAD(P)H-hydrate epimerase